MQEPVGTLETMSKLEELVREVCALPAEQRLTLVRRVLASDALAGDTREAEGELDRVWEAEIQERMARFDRGEGLTHPAERTFTELVQSLQRDR